MFLVDHIVANIAPALLSGRERDSIVMTSEERRWPRRRVRTTNGREVALALPTGTILEAGQLLIVEPRWYLEVEAAEEPVIAAFPSHYTAALRLAFEIGNHHFPLALEGETILVPDDSAMEHLLNRLGVRWERRNAVFNPIGRGHRHGD